MSLKEPGFHAIARVDYQEAVNIFERPSKKSATPEDCWGLR